MKNLSLGSNVIPYWILLPIVAVTVVLYPTRVNAITLEQVRIESNIFLQSLVVDADLLMMAAQLPEAQFDGTFHYVSSTDAIGWSGVLTGSLAGQPLVVDYAASSLGYSEADEYDGVLSWQSKNRPLTIPWTGSGQAALQIGSISGSPITLSYDPVTQQLSAGVSGNFGIINWTLLGTKRPDEHQFVLDSAVGVGLGPVSLAELEAQFQLHQQNLDYLSRVRGSFLFFHSRWRVFDEGTFSSFERGVPITNVMNATVVSVPEPPTWTVVLMGLGLLACGVAGKGARIEERQCIGMTHIV